MLVFGYVVHTGSGWTNVPDFWDKSVLLQAEQQLAKAIGPLAGVLVRRAARECTDLPHLYTRLAEQVTNPEQRTAFLERATSISGSWPRRRCSSRPSAG